MGLPINTELKNGQENSPTHQLDSVLNKDSSSRTVERYVIPGYDTLNAKDLPENWVKLLHDSGLTIYFNTITCVATLSRPFIVAPEDISDAGTAQDNVKLQEGDPEGTENVTFDCPIRNDSSDDNGRTVSMDAEKEKEEGELSTDEDEDGETDGGDVRHHGLEPPPKRPCLRDAKPGTVPAVKMSDLESQHENSLKQDTKPESDGDTHNVKLLTPEEVREYCNKLFKLKRTNAPNFRNRWDRLRFYRTRKANQRVNSADCSTDDLENNSMEQKAKERIFRLFDKSPICILHEYCQGVLHVQSTFKPVLIENMKQLFHYAIVVNNVTYPTGSGNSKKLARSEAARLALIEMLPEYKAFCEEKMQSGSPTTESTATTLSEADLDLFRTVGVTDRQVYDIVIARQLNCAAPYAIFGEYVKRHCIPESDVQSNMSIRGKNNHIYEIRVGEHRVQVQCKNKRFGRNHAAQEMLAILHPTFKTWADFLELYGPNTKPDRKSENEAILDAQTRHSNSVKTGVIRILKAKMLELSYQWEACEEGKRKGKFNVSPDHLPVVHFHPDSATNVYSYPPPDPSNSEST